MTTATARDRFRALHESGTFVMANAWDIGSAKLLAGAGCAAIATTSSGHAASLGRLDQAVTEAELLTHAAELVAAVDIPVSVDSERCYADDPEGVAAFVERLAATGAAGCSIEDYDPATASFESLPVAVERVVAAAEAAHRNGMVLTARAENLLYGSTDLEDTISRLVAYRAAGADVVYAPGLNSIDSIARIVAETAAPVNVLSWPNGPGVSGLAAVGVRRVSTGGTLSSKAYAAALDAVRALLDGGGDTGERRLTQAEKAVWAAR